MEEGSVMCSFVCVLCAASSCCNEFVFLYRRRLRGHPHPMFCTPRPSNLETLR